MLIGQDQLEIGGQPQDIVHLWEETLLHGEVKSNLFVHVEVQRQNIEPFQGVAKKIQIKILLKELGGTFD